MILTPPIIRDSRVFRFVACFSICSSLITLFSLLIRFCSFLVTFCLLLRTFCSLLVTFCLLLVTFCLLLVTFYSLHATCNFLLVTLFFALYFSYVIYVFTLEIWYLERWCVFLSRSACSNSSGFSKSGHYYGEILALEDFLKAPPLRVLILKTFVSELCVPYFWNKIKGRVNRFRGDENSKNVYQKHCHVLVYYYSIQHRASLFSIFQIMQLGMCP